MEQATNLHLLNLDGLSDSQVQSKLWLCRELERVLAPQKNDEMLIVLLAGWYAMAALMLTMREQVAIRGCINVDLDQKALAISERVNDSLRFQGKFRTQFADINFERIDTTVFGPCSSRQQVWINCSTEHLDSDDWMNAIPEGAWVVLQGTDMKHVEHTNPILSEAGFNERFGSALDVAFSGELQFPYNNFNFSRFMLIGRRRKG